MEQQQENVFKALADVQRRRLLRLLRSRDMAAGDIALALELTPGTTSHHLSVLRNANLVRVRRDGQMRIYTLNTSALEEIMLMLSGLFQNSGEKNV